MDFIADEEDALDLLRSHGCFGGGGGGGGDVGRRLLVGSFGSLSAMGS